MALLRCPKFLRCLTAYAGNFDRGHSLTSLYPPLAALSSLPTSARPHCTLPAGHAGPALKKSLVGRDPCVPPHIAPLCNPLRRGRRLPTVVPADSQAPSCLPIGALPRNHLASSAAGSASPISPTTRPGFLPHPMQKTLSLRGRSAHGLRQAAPRPPQK